MGGITLKLIAKSVHRCGQGIALLLLVPLANVSYAAEQALAAGPEAAAKDVEEIVVTGSYIKGSAEDAALPIDVISQQDLQQQGNPSVLELIRNLGITAGNIGEENQFQPGAGQGVAATTTINLRGLGSARTLTLINSHRQVPTEGYGVDVSIMPQIAIERTEILKDGAAALYGSDAIAGVANFLTRGDFEGLEVTGSNQWIEDTDGQQYAGVIFGMGNDTLHWMTALEYDTRNELKISDRDWALLPRAQNTAGGWTSTPNPGTIIPASAVGVPNFAATQPDSQCLNLGGNIAGAGCAFQYTFYDNLVNPTNTAKSWTEVSWDISDHQQLHFEGMYTRLQTETNTSPSYAPQTTISADRLIAPNHPGLVYYKADNPTSAIALAGPAAPAYDVARAFGVTGWYGDSQRGDGTVNTYRLGLDLTGDSFDGAIGYDFGVTYSSRERVTETPDTVVEKMAFALDGLGGPNCTPGGSNPLTSTPGIYPCMYYNPFSNAIAQSDVNGNVNPQYHPTFIGTDGSTQPNNNPLELGRWLVEWQQYNVRNELLVWDAVLNGETPWELSGGKISWAAGVQARNEKYDVSLNDLTNLAISPCTWNSQESVDLGNVSQAKFDACQSGATASSSTGKLGFLSGYNEFRSSRTIYAAFSELAVPITDTLDMQLAVRYEDYGQEGGGSTIDPKAAIRWELSNWLTLRGSISTTFRGPPQSYLSGEVTTLGFVVPTGVFKAVVIVGNPDLEPERAITSNLGFIVNTGGFTMSLDYWDYNFSDPFGLESQTQLVSYYSACFAAGTLVSNPNCAEVASHIFPVGTAPSGIERVNTFWVNGSKIKTNGLDLSLSYAFDLMGGELTAGTDGSYILQYQSDDFVDIGGVTLAPGGDFAGFYNITANGFAPIPELKGNVYLRYNIGGLSLSTIARYIDDYKDAAPPPGAAQRHFKDIDSMTTYDITALYQWRSIGVAASVFNLTDEDPPWVGTNLNYDANTHSALGRMFKLQLTYTMGGQ